MIDVKKFVSILRDNELDFYCGVPDSLLKDFCAYIKDNVVEENNIIAANEGNAVGIASGYYLATGKIPVVYMQNSGLGNIVNPILSLQDKMVYSIPTLLLIGWRGEPGIKDEPQHVKQGLITLELLETMGIKYSVIDESYDIDKANTLILMAKAYMKTNNEPYAIVVKKNTFEEYKLKNISEVNYEMTREQAIEVVVNNIEKESVIVSTTGMTSRELFEIRERHDEGHEKDFLTVGSMGHASQIALGIALSNKEKAVYCLDGDGALLMHLGGMAIIGSSNVENFKHILINNGAHDSVGGQDTVGFNIDIKLLAKSLGYKEVITCTSITDLESSVIKLRESQGPSILEIKVKKGARKNLGRPTTTPIENKNDLMSYLIS